MAKDSISIETLSVNQIDPVMGLLKAYLDSNPTTGYIIFQVYEESPLYGVLPISNAKITVSKLLGDNYFISKVVMTNEDGKTDPVPLPTVQAGLSTVPSNNRVTSNYIARVESPDFTTKDVFDIQIFEGITSIIPIKLIPDDRDLISKIYKSNPQSLCKLW